MGTFGGFPYSNSIGIVDVVTTITVRNKRERTLLNFFTVTDWEHSGRFFLM